MKTLQVILTYNTKTDYWEVFYPDGKFFYRHEDRDFAMHKARVLAEELGTVIRQTNPA